MCNNPYAGVFRKLLSSAYRVTINNDVGMQVAAAKLLQRQPYIFYLSVSRLYVNTGISASGQWDEKVAVR